MRDYREKTGKEALWTNSMFSGMPGYQIDMQTHNNVNKILYNIITLGIPYPISTMFLLFVGMFLLLCVIGIDKWISAIGGIAYGMSSYFFIIVNAGHTSKAIAISLMAFIIAGFVLIFRKKYLLGGLIVALFLSLQLYINHVQITYYTILLGGIYVLYEIIMFIKERKCKDLLYSFLFLFISIVISILPNTTQLWTTYEYGKYTTRGKSELSFDKNNKTTGLDKDYATAWSYGISETMTLLIPNYKGGESKYIYSEQGDEKYLNEVDNDFKQLVARWNRYWGEQPFTSGPVYAGAIIMFLFLISLLYVKNNFKWWLFGATIVSIILSWGRHFMGITDFMLDYFPFYNKFRAVSMILVIASLTIPVMAVMGLDELIKNKDLINKKIKFFYISYALTGGLCLLIWLMPTVFNDFTSQDDIQQYNQLKSSYPDAPIEMLKHNIELARIAIMKADTIRSFWFITLAALLLFIYLKKKKVNVWLVIIGISLFVLLDMWAINRRHLNSNSFGDYQKEKNGHLAIPMQEYDYEILKDKDPNYRVLNLAVNTFNDATTSYYHKSIGGYHGAKLKRYQELIEYHLSKMNYAVINMLNTRYIIGRTNSEENSKPVVHRNPDALGNAWFIKNVKIVENADSEIMALYKFNPKSEAIVDKRYKDYLKGFKEITDTTNDLDTIVLTHYEPNYLVYNSNSSSARFAVFSEIYYDKGWDAYIDGKKSDYIRVNYGLRGMNIPEGKHIIEFKFEPQSYFMGEKVSLGGSIILLLSIVSIIVMEFLRYKNKIKAEILNNKEIEGVKSKKGK